MARARIGGSRSSQMDPSEELTRLVALQVRFLLGSQAQAITEMNRVGIGASRIAELLGTSANTVNVALNRAKREREKAERG